MGEAGSAHRQFPSTHWSIVETVGREDVHGPRPALAELLRRYLPAFRAHLRKRGRVRGDEIDDLLQSFAASKFLEADLVGAADRSRGKLRTLLLTALDRFVISHQRGQYAEKRGANRTEGLDAARGLADPADHPDRRADVFDVAWAREILRQTLQRMQQQCDAESRADLWGVFQSRVLGPTLHGAGPGGYEELVQRFMYRSPSQLWNAVRAAKQLFARTLRAVISEYAENPEAIEAELRDLRSICARLPQDPAQDDSSAAYP